MTQKQPRNHLPPKQISSLQGYHQTPMLTLTFMSRSSNDQAPIIFRQGDTEMNHTKKSVMVAAALVSGMLALPTLSTAQGDSVYSVNVVGFQKTELPPSGQFILAAPPFQTGEPATLLSIFGTNTLRQNNNYLNCDRVILFNTDEQTYQTWAQWTDGVFYRANNASEWAAGISGNPELSPGTGFWILSSSSSTTNTLTFVGDVILDEEIGVNILEGLHILGYPFSSEIAMQESGFAGSGATANNNYLSADQISIYQNGQYQTYAVWTDGQWYRANNASEWAAGILSDEIILPGQGFFYRARNNLTWTETNRYLEAVNN